MKNKNNTINLLEEAQKIESYLVEKRKEVFDISKNNYQSIKYKNFNGLLSGFKYKKLPEELLKKLEPSIKEIEVLKNKALLYREKRDIIIENYKANDVPINTLDPKTDIIPEGIYPKLNNNCIYSLRGSCDSGQNTTSFWARCEFMKYDLSKSPFDAKRWRCTYEG